MNTLVIQKGHFLVNFNKTVEPLYVDKHRDFKHLLEPDIWYEFCKRKGHSQEETIDTMLKMLHVRRIFSGDYLGDLDLCIALIGPRGSGKSVGMTGISILDGLLAGKRVVSNLPIAVRVVYRDCQKVFRTESLDAALMLDENEFNENYYDCLICVDEVNTYIADSQRTMTNQALTFSYILQQMRHRRLSFVFTTQSEGWNTNRVRFQTDFYIQCRDAAMFKGKPRKEDIGRHSQWRIHDMSGLQTGEVLQNDSRSYSVPPFAEKEFWNTPFWHAYDTQQMQKREKYVSKNRGNGQGEFDEQMIREKAMKYQAPTGLIIAIRDIGLKRMQKDNLWEMLEITNNRSEQTKKGMELLDLGCIPCTVDGKRGYEFPTTTVLNKRLGKMNLSRKENADNGK